MTTIEQQQVELDPADVEAFADRMIGIVNGAATALMTSIGHQTGLFETLAGRPPSTSTEIAAAAGLDERYVREWLNAMTTARFVVHDPEAVTYALPGRARCPSHRGGGSGEHGAPDDPHPAHRRGGAGHRALLP